MVDVEKYGWDDTPTPDMGLDESKAPQVIQKLAQYVLDKRKGKDVASAYSQAMLASGIVALAAEELAKQVDSRNTDMETFVNAMLLEMTDKDVISAPEIIQSRDGEVSLEDRLDRDVGRTRNEFDQRSLNIHWFSHLVVDGDWTIPIQTAIDSLTEGGIILFPEGNYTVIEGNITMASNITLQGVSMDKSIINFVKETSSVSSSQYIFKANLVENIYVKNIHLTATTTYDTGATYSGKINGMIFDKVDNVYFEYVKVSNFNIIGVHFVSTVDPEHPNRYNTNVSFLGCIFDHNRSTGVNITATIGVTVMNCVGTGAGLKGDIATGYGMVVGGKANSTHPMGVKDVIVVGNHFHNNWRKGLDVHNGVDVTVSDNNFRDNLLMGLYITNSGNDFVTGDGSVVITGNTFVNDGISDELALLDSTSARHAVIVTYGSGGDEMTNNPISNIVFDSNIIRDYEMGPEGTVVTLNSRRQITMTNNQIDLNDKVNASRILNIQSHRVEVTGNIIEFHPMASSLIDMMRINYNNSGHILIFSKNIIFYRSTTNASLFSIYKTHYSSIFTDNMITRMGSGPFFNPSNAQLGDLKATSGNLFNNDGVGVKLSSKNSTVREVHSTLLSSDLSNPDSLYSTVLSSRAVLNPRTFSVAGGHHPSQTAPSDANRKWELSSTTGDITHTGQLRTSFADFAEYFENQEFGTIPLGTLVSLVGDKVLPSSKDDEVLGVVSGSAGIALGDSPFSWQGRYVVGEFGEPVFESIINEDGTEVVVPKENPDYDDDQVQIARSKRPDEWTLVGLLGQVYVRVDDTVSPGSYVSSGGDGIGTSSESVTNIRVMRITKKFDGEYGIAYCLIK